MAVKLELYRVFKEVAESGNISVAAKNLYISQSAVSQSIKQLETALQARLFAAAPGRHSHRRGTDALSVCPQRPGADRHGRGQTLPGPNSFCWAHWSSAPAIR